MGLKTVASIEFNGMEGVNQAALAERFDAFREAALPGTDWGLTMSNLRHDEVGLVIDLEVEGASDLDEAQEKLDNFRESVSLASEFGVTIWNMRFAEDLAPRIGF